MRISETHWAFLLAVLSIAVLCVKWGVVTFGPVSVDAGPISMEAVDSKKPYVVAAICFGLIVMAIVGVLSGVKEYVVSRYNIAYKANPALQGYLSSEVEKLVERPGNIIPMTGFRPGWKAKKIDLGLYVNGIGYQAPPVVIQIPYEIHAKARRTGIQCAFTLYGVLLYVVLPLVGVFALYSLLMI